MKHAISYFKYRQRGDSLLEVMLAIGLIGVAALSLVGLQLASLRIQQATLRYAQAVQLVDAAAEALRADYPVSRVQTEWQARASALLPGADIHIVDKGENVSLITLRWQEAKQSTRELNQANADCPLSSSSEAIQCVSVAVAQ